MNDGGWDAAHGRAVRLVARALSLRARVRETVAAVRARRALVQEAVATSRNERYVSLLRRLVRERHATKTTSIS
jgi:hypothetical protein